MKKGLLTKVLLSSLVIVSAVGLNPIKAHAEWRQNSTGWWYTKGSLWSVGWDNINGKWYHFNKNGYMDIGWLNDGGKWYYLDKNGDMKTGWINYKDKWYYLDGSGSMVTGWLNDDGKTYLLGQDGAMVTGSKLYKFKPSGELISAEPYIDEAKKQKQAEVSLYGNPTTGYTWEYTIGDNSIVKLDSKDFISENTDPEVCGAGGTFTWKFSGLKAGTTEITFKYLRPWDESSLYETKTYVCTVDKDKNILLEEK
ncbi:protease inhibitor I42 family protein [Clostridium sp. SM-530-WT-3G]|uniref:protease inhibitor I42 family protein n=1 Tax=Clostridium sp. SM-530-WT-3G TaxID=2725303 RepID=UPI00145E5A8C|nr:protease inhibitor I42 family protein [Clostridium sp. SM-530-WT-3G]NME82041.1 cell wall-binding protein [Clostridium sp. SM-530-WT-3G]